ncbi:hypothetical protein M9458_052470 [Cirrhinus mrigala]|uniref:Uncharacterized protein n=1 Tax=Cirrhinus mrigala TaxID=683832 RepID=A0ABD0MRT8_CIRMR
MRGLFASASACVPSTPGRLSLRREPSLALLAGLALLPPDPLSPSSPTRSTARSLGSEACSAVSSPWGTGSTLCIPSSEEVDIESIDEVPQTLQYEELLEVVTHVVAKLNVNWPAEKQAELQRSKLDERFLRNRPPPSHQSLPFFPNLHSESDEIKKDDITELKRTADLSLRATKERSGAGELATPAGVSQAGRTLPARYPLQDAKLAAQTTPEASLKRLVPLVDYLAAWKLLTDVSAWVLHTVERGYCIQFGATPPPFNGVFPTLVGPEQSLVMEQQVDTLLWKETIEVVPPHDRESGFYSRYFIVPKKDRSLRPILDLRQLNRSVMRLKFKMLIVKQVMSQIRKFLRFAFRGEAYRYRILPFDLAFSTRTFTKVVEVVGTPHSFRSQLKLLRPSSNPELPLRGHCQQGNCPVGTVLEFLQDRFSAGLAHSTLKVYVAAISAYHAPLGGFSVGLRYDHGSLPEMVAITPVYESLGLPSPLGVKAHSTRGMAASKAFLEGVPMQNICNTAGWSTPLTFIRFYDLDLVSTQLEFLNGNIPGYVCNYGSPRERDAASQAILLAFLRVLASALKLNAGSSAPP